MNADLNTQKDAMRKKIRDVLKNFPVEKRAADSPKVRALLRQQLFWKQAAAILFFAPLADEVDVWPLADEALAGGKTIALPRFDPVGAHYVAGRIQNLQGEIMTGQFGIREPGSDCVEIPLNTLGLVLVPGIAFDLRGRRLGRGSGFYDRLLEKFSGVKCGIAFDEQMVDEVPTAWCDVRMDFILTPTYCATVVE